MGGRLLATQERPVTRPGPAGVRVRVGVLGGDPLSREGVIRFLEECPELHVVPAGLDGPGSSEGSGVDVAVVVVDQVDEDAVRLLRGLRVGSGPRVVVVVGDLDPEGTVGVVQAGAVGIVRRVEVTRTGLRQLIRSVVAGKAVVPPDVLASLLGRPSQVPGVGRRSGVMGLNDREAAVLTLLSEGSDTREIATSLCYSERTVKSIIQDVTHRFGLRNRSHAVAYALRQGLI